MERGCFKVLISLQSFPTQKSPGSPGANPNLCQVPRCPRWLLASLGSNHSQKDGRRSLSQPSSPELPLGLEGGRVPPGEALARLASEGPSDGAAASGPSWWISSAAEGQHSGVMLDDENTRVPVSRVFPGAGAPRGVAQPPALHFAVSHRAGRAGCPMLSPYASPWTASRIPHPTLISARALAVPSVPGLPAGLLWGQHSLLSLSLYTPVIFNSAYANPKSGMSSGPGPRGNGHGANFLPFLPLFLYNTQQRFSSAA